MFDVPFLVDFDQELLIIEISIVQPPYLLDFGKVYLDHPPTHLYDEQMMANAHVEWEERFGKRWSKVHHAMKMLEKLGIYTTTIRGPATCALATRMTGNCRGQAAGSGSEPSTLPQPRHRWAYM